MYQAAAIYQIYNQSVFNTEPGISAHDFIELHPPDKDATALVSRPDVENRQVRKINWL
jgi:hypothetical protein